MTLEEAIAVLEESKRQNEVMRDNPSTFWASHQMENGVKNTVKRIAALDMALTALRPVSREQVEKVWRGEWIKLSAYRGMEQYKCSKCGQEIYVPEFMGEPIYSFCPMCSSAMMDSSVDLMIDKLGEMKFE